MMKLNKISLLMCICFIFHSCDEKSKKITANKHKPSYLISLSDTITKGVPYTFHVKFFYSTTVKKEDYFSHLILLDSMDVTLNNITEKKETLYEIQEIATNYWKVKRTFNEKGDFIIKGGIYVSTIEFKEIDNDSLKVIDNEKLFYLEKKIFVK